MQDITLQHTVRASTARDSCHSGWCVPSTVSCALPWHCAPDLCEPTNTRRLLRSRPPRATASRAEHAATRAHNTVRAQHTASTSSVPLIGRRAAHRQAGAAHFEAGCTSRRAALEAGCSSRCAAHRGGLLVLKRAALQGGLLSRRLLIEARAAHRGLARLLRCSGRLLERWRLAACRSRRR